MNDVFLQHQAGVLAFLLALLAIALTNLVVMRRLGTYAQAHTTPRVSILAPARNEDKNIGACVSSLLAQEYADYEVIVLDDDSTDGTAAELALLVAQDSRLLTLQGSPLPAGWTGKNWACHQLAQKATGDLLLFVDADTRHHRLMLRDAVAAQVSEQADLISAVPRQEVVTWAEKLIVPVIPLSVLIFVPLALAYRLRTPMLSAAIGQFMLFRRQAYEAVGGHDAVRANPVDDLALARRIKASGMRWRLLDGAQRVECRMYRDAGEVVRGVSRTLFAVFANRVFVYLFIWVWVAIVFLEPIIVLALGAAGVSFAPKSLWLAGLSVVVSLSLALIAYRRFRIPGYLALCYPLTIGGAAILAMRSAFVNLTGRATWKGRPAA